MNRPPRKPLQMPYGGEIKGNEFTDNLSFESLADALQDV